MPFEQIKYEKENGIGIIILNRPDKLNAITPLMVGELMQVLDQADEDDEVRVLIFTGAGRGYCAGAELRAGGESVFDKSTVAEDEYRDSGGMLNLRTFEMKKPVIAAINGPAVGLGATMTLPMDIRLASENAKMGFVFSRRAISPEGCCTWFLPRIVGIGQAAEWLISGRIFSSQEALQAGLVHQVLAADDLMPAAMEKAREIVENTSSISVALAKQLVWRMLGEEHPMDAHRIESKAVHFMGQSEDCKEGVNAFLEKRKPDFPMKLSRDLPKFYPWWPEFPFKKK
ncbi:crotonase/enoyl-CoA hydratase family protein [Thermodesulfobacteriota bacterium]